MSKHTPGPWRLVNTNDGPVIGGAVLGYLATTRGRFAVKPAEEEAENARLIAAAPELLDALIEVTEELVGWVYANSCSDPEASPGVIKARAAIAKATGDA